MITKKFLSDVKKRLLAEQHERLQKSNRHIDIDTEGDETDEVQGNIQIELHNQFVILNNAKLLQIKEALDRLDNNTYGLCVDCDNSISEKRLMINPYYLTCISCAEEREVEEKRKRT